MTLSGWRIVKSRYAKAVWTGQGAREAGGRWNSPGVAVVYTAESRSLAALELLVHLGRADLLVDHYALSEARFDESWVTTVDRRELPPSWSKSPAPEELQRIGDLWARALASAILKVPSALVQGESNYLLNPAHPDFAKISLGRLTRFKFDPRLWPSG